LLRPIRFRIFNSTNKMRDSAGPSGVVIRVGDRTLILSAEIVREVAEVIPVTPLPQVPEVVLGVGTHRGMPVTILDGRRLAGVAPGGDGPGALILCEVRGRRVGVVVDDVLGVGGDAAAWDLAGALAPLFDG
jgi:chemotaxis signal transduction protein